MATSWDLTNLGKLVKQLGGLETQTELYPSLIAEGYTATSEEVYSRTGAILTGYTEKTNTGESSHNVIQVDVSLSDLTADTEIMLNDGLTESWEIGNVMRPKYVITFTR